MEKIKKQGYKAVVGAIAIQLTLGIAYVWSVFQTGIANSIFNGDNAAAGLTFSLLLVGLGFGSVIGGKLTTIYSTARVVFIGGIILGAGFFLASLVTANTYWLLWVTYGVMGGLGMGFTYSTTIACAQKWFPHKKGLVTGIIVSALGFGGVVFTPIIESLIVLFGGEEIGEQKTFIVLSVIFLVVCGVGSIFMKNPPDGYNPLGESAASTTSTPAETVKSYNVTEMIKTPQFYLVSFTFLLTCMGGLMMMAFAKPIAVAKGLEATATIGVLAITMFNSAGRLIWGMISDKLGRINTLMVIFTGSAICSLLVNAATSYFVFVLIAFIGFFYGGIVGTIPSLVADIFGPKNMATNYGFVLLFFGAGAIVSSQIAGYYRNIALEDINLMFPAFVIASCCAVAGMGMMIVLRLIQKRK